MAKGEIPFSKSELEFIDIIFSFLNNRYHRFMNVYSIFENNDKYKVLKTIGDETKFWVKSKYTNLILRESTNHSKKLFFTEGKLEKLNNVTTKPNKPNKTLLFEGKDLNLSERYKIANKVLNIDKEIRKLNMKDLEKYQLLAYILGCNKDNARNLMNGTYNSKDRDLTKYFNDLGLKE
jgi:hypothetical protein